MSVGFLYCLKRERNISVKPILGGVKTAFRCIPAWSIKFSYLFKFLIWTPYSYWELFLDCRDAAREEEENDI